ncbi:MAG TPA: hypothetical protein VML55_21705 [Planctomycetaceae bacterium]|nr:hypothetical protein [Planctomycetaceae bacterium]
MQLCYFVIDQHRTLHRVSREAVEGLWRNEHAAGVLDLPLGGELRLVTVLVDENLLPVVCYFARFRLRGGLITAESKHEAYDAMTARHQRRYDHPAAQRQFAGWPGDWQRQLAVALDVPAAQLRKLGLGGPLLMSDLWGIPIDRVVQYFEEAAGGRTE